MRAIATLHTLCTDVQQLLEKKKKKKLVWGAKMPVFPLPQKATMQHSSKITICFQLSVVLIQYRSLQLHLLKGTGSGVF